MCKKRQRRNQNKKEYKYIYQSYTNHYYNNNHYIIGNLFLPVLCALVVACVSMGSRSLLKLSQPGSYWQAWKILGAVSEAERYRGIFFAENNALVPDGEHLFVVQYKQ